MPTRSEYLRITMHNLGPLTTTFTAPASCTQLASAQDAAYVYGRQINPDYPNPRGPVACTGRPIGDCQPNGSRRDEVEGRGVDQFLYGVAYYSPGLQCPAGWTTAGAAARSGMNATGVLTQDVAVGNIATQINRWIDPTETMAICCPTNYNLETIFFSWCTSSLPPVSSFTYSDLCYPANSTLTTIFSELDGTKLEQGLVEGWKTGTITSYGHDPILSASGTYSADVVFATVPAMTLIYREQDLTGESSGVALRPSLLHVVVCLFILLFGK